MNLNENKSIDTSKYNKRLMGNVVRLPVVISRAKGCKVYDGESNRWLLDFWGDEGVCSLGYNTREYRAALRLFHDSLAPHQLPDVYPHEKRWQAAEIICDRTGMDRIFFANSGTEANEAMIKIARKYWWDKEGRPMLSDQVARIAERHVILTVEGNFHGRTGLSLACTDPRASPYHRWGFGPMAKGFGVIDARLPDEPFFAQTVTNGHEHKPRGVFWDEVAAIILAPVLGNNLVQTYDQDFWEALAEIREKHGVLILFDDVQAGNGRSGHYATWQEPLIAATLGRPDAMTLGKGMALGWPMSAMLASEEVAQAFTPGVHFNTFAGSPWVCHMAVFYYEWLGAKLGEIRRTGETIRHMLSSLEWVQKVDGWGMLNAFTPRWNGFDGFQFCHKARQFGLLIVTHRPYGPIRFTPPMNVSFSELAEAIEILDQTYKALTEK